MRCVGNLDWDWIENAEAEGEGANARYEQHTETPVGLRLAQSAHEE